MSREKLIILTAGLAVVALGVGIIIGRFAIPMKEDSKDSLFSKLVRDADPTVAKKIQDRMDPQNIKKYLK